jgi:pimeloyl-ACP methyl ester carboxylesterase
MLDATDRLSSFDAPALVVWASEDRVMPPEHGHRLAELRCPYASSSFVVEVSTTSRLNASPIGSPTP